MDRSHKILLVILLAASLGNANLYGQWIPATRDTLTRDSFRDENTVQSLVCDATNALHAIWQRANQGGGWRIFYAKKPGTISGWLPAREVGDSAIMAFQPALAVDRVTATPWVAYRATYASSDEIVVAKDSAGNWRRTRITTDNIPAYSPTIAMDQSGTVHCAWIGQNASSAWKIFYAMNIGGAWRIHLLAASELGDFGSGAAPFIAVTASGVAHIFYRGGNYPDYRIHHAFNVQPGDTTWTYEVIGTPNGADYTSNAVVDATGALHLVVTGNDGFGFPPHAYYLRKPVGGAWSTPELANPGGAGSASSLVIDAYGKAHITWNEVSGNIITGNLYYATNKTGSWSSAPVQLDAKTFNGVLAIDGTGKGHILAYNGATFATQEIIVIHSPGPLTSVKEKDGEVTERFELMQNYPNPFNSSTHFGFRITDFGFVSIRVVDLLGREVAMLVNEVKEPGEYKVKWDATGMPSGVYFYQLRAKGQVQSRKMILLR